MHVRLTGLRKATNSLDPSPRPLSFSSVGRIDTKTRRPAIDVAYSLLCSHH